MTLKEPKIKLFLLFIIISISSVFSQDLDISILTIPSELKEKANAVIRKEQITIEILGVNKMNIKREIIVTVLNDAGNKHTRAYDFYDNTIKIKNQEAYIYDKFGKEIKHFKRSDFSDRSALSSNDIYTDNRYKYLNYTPTQYPYTLRYTSEIETTETAFVNPWKPISSYYVSVQSSKYIFINKTGIPFRFKESNFLDFDIHKINFENKLSYSVTNLKAFSSEELAPDIEQFTPNVKIALNNFSLVKVEGQADDWKTFGKWQYDNLIEGLDAVSEETKQEINQLVEGVKSEKEKVKLIYEYVQNKTRYISVQLGIGGWKPYPANEVDNLGYGDCKGLTNYTKALLNTQNIEAFYSVVWAGSKKKNIDEKFASMQGNHVILNVPLENEELWLECTSQVLPFNYLGNFTDDRNVLVLQKDGGKIKRTVQYINDDNIQKSEGVFKLFEDGSFSGSITIVSEGSQYNSIYNIDNFDNAALIKYYKSYWDDFKNLSIEASKLINDKNEVRFTQDISMAASNYGYFVTDKLIFIPNAFNRNEYVPKKYKNRKLPFLIQRGYTDVDTYVFTLPEDYVVDFLPEAIHIETKFGDFHMSVIDNKDGSFTFDRKLAIYKGSYPPEDYEAYRSFRKTIKKNDISKVVFKKIQ